MVKLRTAVRIDTAESVQVVVDSDGENVRLTIMADGPMTLLPLTPAEAGIIAKALQELSIEIRTAKLEAQAGKGGGEAASINGDF